MTDTADSDPAPDAAADPQPEAAPPGLLDGLGDDNRRVAETKGWDTADKIVDSYRNLEAKMGDSVRPPEDGADPQEWDAFYRRLGRPDAPSDYAFALPDGLDENFPYDGESAGRFAEWAHEAGLSPRQAQRLHDRFVQDLNGQFEALQGADAQAVEDAHAALVKAWGAPSSERYRRNVELASRALRELGGDSLKQALRDRGALMDDGAIADPAIASMLQQAGERLFAEDQVFTGERAANNPFAAGNENITEQGRIARADPDLARNLIRAANRESEFPGIFAGGGS